MPDITGLTAARMLEIEAESVVGGSIVGDDLILTKHDGSTVDAGNVRGATGEVGPAGPGYVAKYVALKRVTDDFALTNAGWTVVSWDGEVSDVHGLHDPANPTYFTADEAGVWVVTANIVIHGNYNGVLGVSLDSSVFGQLTREEINSASAVSEWPSLSVTSFAELAAGEHVSCSVWQNGALPLSNASRLRAFRLGPVG